MSNTTQHRTLAEHVLWHYIWRDITRSALSAYAAENGIHAYNKHYSTPHIEHLVVGEKPRFAVRSINDTRASLMKVKYSTLEYLHERLHEEELLSEFAHVHDGDDIISFVIHEAAEL